MTLKTTVKAVAAALALGLAAQANAALTSPGGGNGSLFLTVWDSTRTLSYTRDLGIFVSDFLPNNFPTSSALGETPDVRVTPDTGLNRVFAGDALFQSTFAASDPNNIKWSVLGGDFTRGGVAGTYRVVISAEQGISPTLTGNGIGAIASHGTAVDNINNVFGCGVAGVNSCVTSQSITGSGLTGTFPTTLLDAVGDSLGDTMTLLAFRAVPSGSLAQNGTTYRFQNSDFIATLNLNANGDLTYDLKAIPLPAAGWLLLAGLGGLGFFRRRKDA